MTAAAQTLPRRSPLAMAVSNALNDLSLNHHALDRSLVSKLISQVKAGNSAKAEMLAHAVTVEFDKIGKRAAVADVLAMARDYAETSRAVDRMNLAPSGPAVELIRGDTVQMVAVRWLWDGWLARGKLHILAGAPSTGKTTIALAMAAAITTGGRWPDGDKAEAGSVLIWSGEDDPADTLVPRLAAMGANLSRVHFVTRVIDDKGERTFSPAEDMPLLMATAERIGDVRLLIVDPIVNPVSGDSNKSNDVRRNLQPIVDLASKLDCAALGISHFSKGTAGRDVVERVTGSIAFGALARVVLAAGKIKEDDGTERRLLARAKSNLGPDGGGFGYSIEQAAIPGKSLFASRVSWGSALEGTARELLAEVEVDEEARSEQQDAAEWLRITLESGPLASREIRIAADEAGHAWRTVQRAMKRLGVTTERHGFGKDTKTIWSLSVAPNPSVAPVAPDSKSGANGATGGANGFAVRELGEGEAF